MALDIFLDVALNHAFRGERVLLKHHLTVDDECVGLDKDLSRLFRKAVTEWQNKGKQIRSAGAYFLDHGEKSNSENVPASS